MGSPLPRMDFRLARAFFLFFVFAAVLLIATFTPSITDAANLYWVGSAGGNTNDSANWSSSNPASCTGGGAGVPGSGDIAIFDADCDNNATINANFDVAGININTGYIGTITQNTSITVTIGTSDYIQADGTFAGGNSTIDINDRFTLSGGTFTSTSGTMSVAGSFTITGGTFTHNSGTVTFDG
ncbi:hypothetical protein IIB97_01095, partial [Patescibacteria group bacterium]|nr:hypothetical protein [Patescibacteria group bacterium]